MLVISEEFQGVWGALIYGRTCIVLGDGRGLNNWAMCYLYSHVVENSPLWKRRGKTQQKARCSAPPSDLEKTEEH